LEQERHRAHRAYGARQLNFIGENLLAEVKAVPGKQEDWTTIDKKSIDGEF